MSKSADPHPRSRAARWRFCAIVMGLMFIGSVVIGSGVATAFFVGEEPPTPTAETQVWARTEAEARAKLQPPAKVEITPKFETRTPKPSVGDVIPVERSFGQQTYTAIVAGTIAGVEVAATAKAEEPVETVTVLVAAKNLAMHTAVQGNLEDFFTAKTFPKDDAPTDAIAAPDLPTLAGKFLKRGLRKGDHVTADDLVQPATKIFPPGKRHVAFRTGIDSLPAAMAALPASHVNLVWTTPVGEGTVKMLLVQDVIVVMVNLPDKDGNTGDAVVTVVVNESDLETVLCARATGSLTVELCPPEDRLSSK
jgi:Flp pilus assembly protein CpaB